MQRRTTAVRAGLVCQRCGGTPLFITHDDDDDSIKDSSHLHRYHDYQAVFLVLIVALLLALVTAARRRPFCFTAVI